MVEMPRYPWGPFPRKMDLFAGMQRSRTPEESMQHLGARGHGATGLHAEKLL